MENIQNKIGKKIYLDTFDLENDVLYVVFEQVAEVILPIHGLIKEEIKEKLKISHEKFV